MAGIDQHIRQKYPTAILSETYFLQSVAGTGFVQKDFSDTGAIAILVHNIYWVTTNSAAPFTFTDFTGLVMFTIFDSDELPNVIPVEMCRQGQILKITSSLPAIIFSVSFQYFTLKNNCAGII